jgi:hypothetical protein
MSTKPQDGSSQDNQNAAAPGRGRRKAVAVVLAGLGLLGLLAARPWVEQLAPTRLQSAGEHPTPEPLPPPEPALALLDGVVFQDEQGRSTLRLRHVADLVVSSGAIVAADGIVVLPDELPFTVRVPVGRYPVILSLAESDTGDVRVAFARIQFDQGAPVRWELALRPGQDSTKLGRDEIFGYGVDSGTGSFLDLAALRQLAGHPDYADRIIADLEAHEVFSWSWAEMVLDEASGANAVVFSSGLGDGVYASYLGYDTSGQVVALVTDFGLLDRASLATTGVQTSISTRI